jgi:hypothetical protein
MYIYADSRAHYYCTFMAGEFEVRELTRDSKNGSIVRSLAIDFHLYCPQRAGVASFGLRGSLRINSAIPANVFNCDAVDCMLGPWTNWKPMSDSCVCSPTAITLCDESRRRAVLIEANQYGKQCEPIQEFKKRTIPPCASPQNQRLEPAVFTYTADSDYPLSLGKRELIADCDLATELISASRLPSGIISVNVSDWEFYFAAKTIDEDDDTRARLDIGTVFYFYCIVFVLYRFFGLFVSFTTLYFICLAEFHSLTFKVLTRSLTIIAPMASMEMAATAMTRSYRCATSSIARAGGAASFTCARLLSPRMAR